MLKRGWFAGFNGPLGEAKKIKAELIAAFIGEGTACPTLKRQQIRSGSNMDTDALEAWRIRVSTLALRKILPQYRKNTVTPEFMSQLVHLSYLGDGPKLAREFLNKNGIHLVIERHLPKTFLDGAALKLPNGSPVIALTLRYDRLDNFWFTLCHELAHIALHLDKDDFDIVMTISMTKDTTTPKRQPTKWRPKPSFRKNGGSR